MLCVGGIIVEKIDVLYTANESFLDIMLASILSLIENCNIPNINLHIIAEGFSDETYKKISKVVEGEPGVKIDFYPFEDFNVSQFGIPDWRGTQVANARIFFQEFMKDKVSDIDNLLYLDSDTVVVGDLNNLGEYQESLIYGAKDLMKKRDLRYLNLPAYYNSGVLYINVNEWIENSCQDKLVENIEREKSKLLLPDQDLINITLFDKFDTLPVEYNIGPVEMIFSDLANRIYFDMSNRQVSAAEIKEAKEKPKIYHAYGYGSIKPWLNNESNPMNEDFMKYILQANPSYQRKDIENIFKILAFNPWLMKSTLFVKNLLLCGMERKLTDVKEKIFLKKNK